MKAEMTKLSYCLAGFTLTVFGCAGGAIESDSTPADQQNGTAAQMAPGYATPGTAAQGTTPAYTPGQTVNGQNQTVNSDPGKFDANSNGTTETQPSPNAQTSPEQNFGPECSDQSPLPPSYPQGPVMRITRLTIPQTSAEAREAGCEFEPNTGYGTGLSSLLTLLEFDVDALVNPDATGQIPSVLLMHLKGWMPGQTPNQVGTSNVAVLPGTQIGNQFSLSSSAMANHTDAVIAASADVTCGEINSTRSTLKFDVPLLDERNVVPLVVDASHIKGELRSDAGGVSVVKGTINGYLRRQGLEDVLHGLNAACRQVPAPEVCNGADTLIEGDISELVDRYVVPFLGGLDARIEPNSTDVSACNGDDCNAMTVCIQFETQATTIGQSNEEN